MSDRRTSLSTVLSIVTMVAAGYAVVLVALYAFQSRLVYFPDVPSRVIGPGPDSIGLAYESHEIVTEDGIRLDAWYLPVRDPRGTVLFFHGNAGNISHRLDSLRVFNQLDLATLIFDYRGYGRSEGEVSEQGVARRRLYLRTRRPPGSLQVALDRARARCDARAETRGDSGPSDRRD